MTNELAAILKKRLEEGVPVTGTTGGGGTQYADGAVRGTATGTIAMGDDGTNIQSIAVDTSGNQKAIITDGTNTVNVLKSDGTAAGQNSQLIAGTYLSVPFTTTTVQAVGTTDAGNYRWVSVHITTQGTSSSIAFQGSNDGTNWVSVTLLNTVSSGATLPSTSTTSTNAIFAGGLSYRHFRLNITGISGGTTAGTILFSAQPTTLVAQSSTLVTPSHSIGSGAPSVAYYQGISDGTNLRGVLGVANATNSTGAGIPAAGILAQFDDVSPTAITENQFGNLRMSANRNLYNTIRDAAGNERGANVTASNALVVDGSAVTQPVKETRSTTPSQSSVSVGSSNTAILASNANRLGFTIYNEGSAICYMKLGATASTTSYTCQIASGGYYECPFNYTGAVDGITSASTAQLRITELT